MIAQLFLLDIIPNVFSGPKGDRIYLCDFALLQDLGVFPVFGFVATQSRKPCVKVTDDGLDRRYFHLAALILIISNERLAVFRVDATLGLLAGPHPAEVDSGLAHQILGESERF